MIMLANKQMEYFWETEYKFGSFLEKIFGSQYKRKYSLIGNGVFNLIFTSKGIYEIKYSQSRNGLIPNDNHAVSADKQEIIDTIVNNLKTEVTVSGGKFLTFAVGPWFAKVEIIKKMREPN